MINASPFIWYGGKARAAKWVWQHIGDPEVYVEPFAGSAAILLRRPIMYNATREIICDKSGHISNFWRSVKLSPRDVMQYMKWPTIETDLIARQKWLIKWQDKSIQLLESDPEWHDARAAGWWLWGINRWIARWCNDTGYSERLLRIPNRGGHYPFSKKDRTDRRDTEKYFSYIQERLKSVVVLSGDWKQAITPRIFRGSASCAVVLDPPYKTEGRAKNLYENENQSDLAASESYEWAINHGNKYKIVYFCKDMDFSVPPSWYVRRHRYKANAGYDIAMFSPACNIHQQLELEIGETE